MPEGVVLLLIAVIGWFSAERVAKINRIGGKTGTLVYRLVSLTFGSAGIYLLITRR